MCQLSRGLVSLRYGIEVARIHLHQTSRIAVKVRSDGGELLNKRRDLLLSVLKVPTSRVEGRLRGHVGVQQTLLSEKFRVVIVNVIVCLVDLRLHIAVVRL